MNCGDRSRLRASTGWGISLSCSKSECVGSQDNAAAADGCTLGMTVTSLLHCFMLQNLRSLRCLG